MFKTFFHILNPNSAKRNAVRAFFLKNPSLNYMWVERTSHPAHLETLVLWAFNEGHRDIAVWGGDGTLSRAVQTIYELDAFDKMTVGLVPVGTCNDLARCLKIPAWKNVAKAGLLDRNVKTGLDVGLLAAANLKRIFINNAGFGRTVERLRKKSNPVKDIFSFIPKRLDLEWRIDGAQHFETRDALLGVVCNAPFFNGGMHFAKDVDPSDGKLTGFFETPQSRFGLLAKFLRSRLGGSLSNSNTVRVDAQSVRVESDRDLFPQVDGEPAGDGAQRQIDFSLLPKKLRLCTWR